MSDFVELAVAAKAAIPMLLLERTRLEFAIARHDKEGMREINKTFKHLYLDLRELNQQVGESFLGMTPETTHFDYEQWFLPNQATIKLEEINSRLIAYHRKLSDFNRSMETLTAKARQLGLKQPFVDHLLSHLHMTTLLLRLDLETITGESLQP